jgi:hypothetical protein
MDDELIETLNTSTGWSSILLVSTLNSLRYGSEAEEINWMSIGRLEKSWPRMAVIISG